MSKNTSPVDDDPTLSEEDGIRYLHFGTRWIQGAMRIRKPSELVFAYARQMMAWLLFVEPVKADAIGILGLGAGSLLRYTLRHTRSSVVTVEWNPRVTALCQAYFRLPTPARSVIEHCDAALWLEQPGNMGRYKALMVDLYDAQAQGPVRDSLEFYEGCHRALADRGVMTVNLFGDHGSFPRNMANIRLAFGDRVLELPESDAGNRVVLGLKGPLMRITVQELLDRARLVESEYGLPASDWARWLLANSWPQTPVEGARRVASG